LLLCCTFLSVSIPLPCYFLRLPPPAIHTLSLHDALPIFEALSQDLGIEQVADSDSTATGLVLVGRADPFARGAGGEFAFFVFLADRKSTRLNSSHVSISYAVFCLKKKKCISCTATSIHIS